MSFSSIHSVRCNGCGAPLRIPDSAHFVTCQHCNSELQVEQTSDVVYTKLIEHVAKRIDATQTHLHRVTVKQQIDRLDREWEARRKEILVADAPTNPMEEPDCRNRLSWFLVPGIPIAWGLIVAINHKSGMFVFSMLFAAVLYGIAFAYHHSRFRVYRQELESYLAHRSNLKDRLYDVNPALHTVAPVHSFDT